MFGGCGCAGVIIHYIQDVLYSDLTSVAPQQKSQKALYLYCACLSPTEIWRRHQGLMCKEMATTERIPFFHQWRAAAHVVTQANGVPTLGLYSAAHHN